MPFQTHKTGASTNDCEYYQPSLDYLAQVPIYLLSAHFFKDKSYVIRALRLTSILFWLATLWLAARFLGSSA